MIQTESLGQALSWWEGGSSSSVPSPTQGEAPSTSLPSLYSPTSTDRELCPLRGILSLSDCSYWAENCLHRTSAWLEGPFTCLFNVP